MRRFFASDRLDSTAQGARNLILAPPGAMQSGLPEELADAALADRTRLRFEPAAMAQDLATSVELLTAAIQAIPTDRLDQPGTEGLLAALDASFEALR
jgi:hypothetical protein